MSKVSLIKRDSRRENILESFKLIGKEIKEKIGERIVLIKPNFVSSTIQNAASHIDQIRGILDFLSAFYKDKIIIAEGSAGDTFEGYENFGYFTLQKEYPFEIEFVDLNKDDFENIPISKGESVRVSKTILNPSYFIISAAKLKTHDTVVATLSIKNIAMGGILREDKKKMHQGIKEINHNLLLLAERRMPDLASIDGFYGMEGEGPTYGDMIETKTAIAGLDPLAADRVGIEIMGINPEDVGYLVYCRNEGLGEYNLKKIDILGANLEDCKSEKKLKLHSTIKRQLLWKNE